ncbi:DUF2304 domain-containing protein [Actinomyces culturomici]|uniref:DUF2304 domain-containing protein n=1 Tax=Actinomyces culturomici TaxID=1926276 RepID=UPI000E205D63|nr:DUF2304 domain-containing protein [Actinomyces culturomici]
MMTTYWLAKLLLLVGLGLVAFLILRRPRTASHLALRRLGMLVLILFACFAVLFPHILNDLAHLVGIERGINLLVYGVVLALFGAMAGSYRRDSDTEARLTQLARAVALADAERRYGPRAGGAADAPESPGEAPSRGASRPGDVETPR